MILGLIDEAVVAGARLGPACETLGLHPRTVERWKKQGVGDDRRAGPLSESKKKLTRPERHEILDVVNSPGYRDLPVSQIVPVLADEGRYIGSESTIYRILREEKMLEHRGPARSPQKRHRPKECLATGPHQVWSWDITYLKSPVRGEFYYLYLVLDVWSRKIVAAEVHEAESADLASQMVLLACLPDGTKPTVIHSDNGSPMKGATMVATLDKLGIRASFSRPSVSNDNPYSEALFRTAKYRPEYPKGPFLSLEAARSWVSWFVTWYNEEHRHSSIGFVTPEQRHSGEDVEILRRRDHVYQQARDAHPERWSKRTRDWSRIEVVRLNPEPGQAAWLVA